MRVSRFISRETSHSAVVGRTRIFPSCHVSVDRSFTLLSSVTPPSHRTFARSIFSRLHQALSANIMSDGESTNTSPSTPNVVENGLKDLHLQKEDTGNRKGRPLSKYIRREHTLGSDMSPSSISQRQSLQSPRKPGGSSQSSAVSTPKNEEVVSSSVAIKQQPGQPPKLARSTSQKVTPRTPPSFLDYPSKTEEAKDIFQVLPACIYSSKAIGATDHAMDCECTEEWGQSISSSVLSVP